MQFKTNFKNAGFGNKFYIVEVMNEENKLNKEKSLSYKKLKSWKPIKSNISDIIKIIKN